MACLFCFVGFFAAPVDQLLFIFQVGSIGAGGRYDNLIGNFGSKQVPAVGMSLGIERVLTIMEEQAQAQVIFIPNFFRVIIELSVILSTNLYLKNLFHGQSFVAVCKHELY